MSVRKRQEVQKVLRTDEGHDAAFTIVGWRHTSHNAEIFVTTADFASLGAVVCSTTLTYYWGRYPVGNDSDEIA